MYKKNFCDLMCSRRCKEMNSEHFVRTFMKRKREYVLHISKVHHFINSILSSYLHHCEGCNDT